MSYVVRLARPAEYAATGQVAETGYAVDGLLERTDGTQDDDYRHQLLDAAARAAEAELLVAVDTDPVAGPGDPDPGVIGTVTWCPLGSPWRQLAREDHQGEFRMLAVAPAGRRRGVGRALVEACLDRARAVGMTEVVLSSLPTMNHAHALYRSHGFVRVPELDFSPVAGVDLWGFRLGLG